MEDKLISVLPLVQNSGGLDWNSNLLSALVGAAVGAALGAWLSWLFGRPAELRSIKKDNRLAASSYLRAVSTALFAMADDFRNGRIPHRSGHEYIGALKVFEEYVRPLGDEILGRLSKLGTLADEAVHYDAMMYKGIVPQAELEKWANEAEGVAGDLVAAAIRLEGKPHTG
jgi:hypothetical protein